MLKNIISFVLWGNKPIYNEGAIKNANISSIIYPDWDLFFFCSDDVPEKTKQSLLEKGNHVNVVVLPFSGWKFSLNRFLPLDFDFVDYIIFRDCDSRLNKRERSAVNQWIESGKTLHIMRDHPYHGCYPIMAGMFGIKIGGKKMNIKNKINKFLSENPPNQYFIDQEFLKKYIYPEFYHDSIIHDEFFSISSPFPEKRDGLEFVGEKFTENDSPFFEHRLALLNKI